MNVYRPWYSKRKGGPGRLSKVWWVRANVGGRVICIAPLGR